MVVLFMATSPAQRQDDSLCRQLSIIDQSQQYIILIIAALVLSWYATGIQRKQLIESSIGCPVTGDPFPLRALSSVMVIAALLFFYRLSEQSLRQCRCSGNSSGCCSPAINHMTSILVLAASLIRLLDLLTVQNSGIGL